MARDWAEEYRLEQEAKRRFKYEFVPKVAAELGMTAEADEEAWGGRIKDTQGRGYYLSYPYKGKTEISPIYPRSTFGFYKTERGKIGVSVSRGPQVVAREITRRLAPIYESALAKVEAYEADLAVDQGSRSVLTDKLASLFPSGTVSTPGHCQSEHQTELIIHGPGLGGGQVRYTGHGGEVTIGANHGFRVPAEVATQMLAVYGDYCRREIDREVAAAGLDKLTATAGEECMASRWCEIKAGQEYVRDDDGRAYCLNHVRSITERRAKD